MAPVSVVVRGSIGCRFWLHWLSLLAPTVVCCGSSSIISCRSWLQCYLLSFVAPPVSVACGTTSLQYLSIACGSGLQPVSVVVPVAPAGCRSWLQYLSFVAPVSSVVSLLQSPVSPVAHGSGSICISCRSWLRVWSLVAPVAPVSPVVHGSPVSVVSSAHPVAPVSPVVARGSTSGSSICCVCLQYHYLLLVAPVAPVFVACDSCCSCCFNRQPSSVLVIFL